MGLYEAPQILTVALCLSIWIRQDFTVMSLCLMPYLVVFLAFSPCCINLLLQQRHGSWWYLNNTLRVVALSPRGTVSLYLECRIYTCSSLVLQMLWASGRTFHLFQWTFLSICTTIRSFCQTSLSILRSADPSSEFLSLAYIMKQCWYFKFHRGQQMHNVISPPFQWHMK